MIRLRQGAASLLFCGDIPLALARVSDATGRSRHWKTLRSGCQKQGRGSEGGCPVYEMPTTQPSELPPTGLLASAVRSELCTSGA
jgi:hypothetical protein